MTSQPATGPTFYVYQLVFDGSAGKQHIQPLYIHRAQAQAELNRIRAQWAALKASGKGAIFGDVTIKRLTVVGRPLL